MKGLIIWNMVLTAALIILGVAFLSQREAVTQASETAASLATTINEQIDNFNKHTALIAQNQSTLNDYDSTLESQNRAIVEVNNALSSQITSLKNALNSHASQINQINQILVYLQSK